MKGGRGDGLGHGNREDKTTAEMLTEQHNDSPRPPRKHHIVSQIGQLTPGLPSGEGTGQQVLERHLDRECLAQDVQAYICKFRSRTTLREESVTPNEHVMDEILSL